MTPDTISARIAAATDIADTCHCLDCARWRARKLEAARKRRAEKPERLCSCHVCRSCGLTYNPRRSSSGNGLCAECYN